MQGAVGATWIWWGTALVVLVAVARHVAAARRAGRSPSRIGIGVAAAVPVALVVSQRANTPWIIPFFLLVPVVTFTWLWLHRDRTEEVELGPIVFADELRAEVRNVDPPQMFGLLGSPSGRVRLLVGRDMIATRGISMWGVRVSGFSSPGTFGLLDYTFPAVDCEVERPRMGVSSFGVALGKPAIVLRGADGRRTVELALSRPQTVTLDDVQRHLIWAGARPIDGQVVEEPAELAEAGGTGAPQPPFWPPPPGWSPDAGTEARGGDMQSPGPVSRDP